MTAFSCRLSPVTSRAAGGALGFFSVRSSSVYGRARICADRCLRFYTAGSSYLDTLPKLQIGISSFESIQGRKQAYVDKTPLIHKLVSSAPERLTVNAPRRFGKSLLLDTVAEVFRGNKELFQGCGIYDSDFPWNAHTVIKLDLSDIDGNESLCLDHF